jgi:polyisoprenoid-binding protein YceI
MQRIRSSRKLVGRAVLPAAGILAVSLVLAVPARAEPKQYNIDAEHTSVTFKVRHLFSKVPGAFNKFEGKVSFDKENPRNSSVEVVIDAASIDTNEEARDNHLRSDAFFDVENQPRITFKSTGVKSVGKEKLKVNGDLSIRGVKKRVTLDVDLLGFATYYDVERVGFEARTTIDRTDYGVSWNDTVEAGGYVLGNDVEIFISIEAKEIKPKE